LQPAQVRVAGVTGQEFRGRVAGEPNRDYEVQYTTDFRTWTTLETNATSAAGTFEFTDLLTAGPHRFYRAVETR
jgi:hypothetical protein